MEMQIIVEGLQRVKRKGRESHEEGVFPHMRNGL